MTKSNEQRYFSDQYGSVYERCDDVNWFVGKLNGLSLAEFLDELYMIDCCDDIDE